jgi:uncharacterized protein (TIGR00106 family)
MIAEFTIVPLGDGEHLSPAVAEVLKIVDESGLPYELHAMGTIIEGDWGEVIALIGKCHHRVLEAHPRVSTSIRIDDHKGRRGRLHGKVEAVEHIVGRKLGR